MEINDIAKKHHAWLESVGWNKKLTPLEAIALIASEVGEAANECRGDEPTDKLPLEMADIILRTLGMAENLGIDMNAAIEKKMQMNLEKGNKGRIK